MTAAPPVACSNCGLPCAKDQRYCIECGARRGPLPPGVERLIASLQRPELAAQGSSTESISDPPDGPSMPTPRAAAVAVMTLLAFGVVLGSLFSVASPGRRTAVLMEPGPSPTRNTAATTTPPVPAAAPTAKPAPAAAVRPVAAAPRQQPAAATPPPTASKPPPFPSTSLPPVHHVFMIVLSSQGYDQSFGANSTAPYLAQTLTSQGELLANYYAVAQGELANENALISGQGPTPQTEADCPNYGDVSPGTVADMGQVTGDGCVYPAGTQTIGDELTGSGKSWKAYVEDIGNGGSGQTATCRHPGLGQPDDSASPQPGDAYVTWRDPFVYFHSVIDGAGCGSSVVGLDQLAPDLRLGTSAPALSYIVPNRCHDGSDQPCAPGQPAGLPAADSFLQSVVPEITSSPAYQDGGLIAITFDEAPQSGPTADQSACCTFEQYPNVPAPPPSTPAPVHPNGGGGHVGLLLISPFVLPGTVNQSGYYNHFSLLASIEDLLAVPRTGYASDPGVPVFDQSIYNSPTATSSARKRN